MDFPESSLPSRGQDGFSLNPACLPAATTDFPESSLPSCGQDGFS
jgi:hypothetical protein